MFNLYLLLSGLFLFPSVLPDANITLDPDTQTLTCDVDMIMATTEEQMNVEYTWILGSEMGTGLSFDVTEAGQLILIATDTVLDCTNSMTITILEDTEEPIATIVTPTTINCLTTSVDLDGSFSSIGPSIEYQWQDEMGNDIPGGDDGVLQDVDEPGDYVLVVTDSENGCSSSTSVTVIEDTALPVVEAGPDQTLPCMPKKTTVIATLDLNEDDAMFSWTNEIGDLIASNFLDAEILEAGWFYFTATSNINGCTATDSVFIGESNFGSASFTSGTPDCPGDSTAFISVDLSNVENPLSSIIFEGQDAGQQTTFDQLPAGNYSINIIDDQNCNLDTTIAIIAANDFTLDITDDMTVGFNEDVPLLADTDATGGSFSWMPETGLSCIDCPDPIASVQTTTSYTVVVTDENGCTKEATVTLTVDVSDAVGIFVPNVFSPQATGDNAYFYIQGNAAVFNILELGVYDRWGNQVFFGENIAPNISTSGWDGTFNGSDVVAGVYSYYAILEVLDGQRIIKGDITLVR